MKLEPIKKCTPFERVVAAKANEIAKRLNRPIKITPNGIGKVIEGDNAIILEFAEVDLYELIESGLQCNLVIARRPGQTT